MRLGGANQTKTFIAGVRGVAIANGATVIIDPNGKLGTVVSSARYKRDIRGMADQDDKLLKLRPVTYRYKSDATATQQYGLIAEEVEQVYPELVVRNNDNSAESVQYHALIPMLLKQLQTQNRKIADLESQSVTMKARLLRLESAGDIAKR
jgi:hypothetical protein